jgi:hypothetical protein
MRSILAAMTLILTAQEGELGEIFRRLDSDEPAVREAADRDFEKLIAQLGAKAADILKKHSNHPSLEVRARIQRCLGALAVVAECRRVLSVFDLLGLPSCKEKKFVLIQSDERAGIETES